MSGITKRQWACLQAIAEYISRMGYSPTMKKVAEKIETSAPDVCNKVKALREKGYLEQSEHGTRGMVLTAKGWAVVRVGPRGKRLEALSLEQDRVGGAL